VQSSSDKQLLTVVSGGTSLTRGKSLTGESISVEEESRVSKVGVSTTIRVTSEDGISYTVESNRGRSGVGIVLLSLGSSTSDFVEVASINSTLAS
jgi:hypothetical protein